MKRVLLAAVACCVAATLHAQPRIIAHRGFHATEGSARNTVSSLRNAQKIGAWGSECDINMTVDDSLLVVHGDWHSNPEGTQRVHVQRSDYRTVRSIACEGGNIVPDFGEYLAQATEAPHVRLIVEIKGHETPVRETQVTEAVVAMVKAAGAEKQVDYISFSSHVCDELVRMASGAEVAYLNGDMTPDEAKSRGYTGLDYSMGVLRAHPEWIARAHEIGLTVNVWTVNDTADLEYFIAQGVDFITTDNPVEAMRLTGAQCCAPAM